MRRLAALALLAGSALPLHAQSDRAGLVARYDSLGQAFLRNAPSMGATIAVVRGSDTLYLKGIGLQDSAHGLPATATTVYRIGSITKQFTSAGIMRLVEQGRIALTDPLTKYLPEYQQWKAVTIRELLNHTSGIHSYTSNPAWARTWNEPLTPAQIVAFVATDTFDFAPGSNYRYNNTGYVLLGMVLDKVTGHPYPQLVEESMFTPLGMHTAAYCPSRPTDARYAVGYDKDGNHTKAATYLDMTHPYSAGALCMSVPDFLLWQSALTSGKVVSPTSYALMTRGDSAGGKPTQYGFGLSPSTLGTHRLVTHGGDVHGFSAAQLWFPDDSLRVVVFTNTLGSGPGQLATNLAAATLGLPFVRRAAVPPTVALAPDQRQRYSGTYDLALPGGHTLPLTVTADSTGISAQAAGQPKNALVYLGTDTFGAAFDPSFRLTIVFDAGRASKAVLIQGGGTIEGPRRP
jgi:D-alanyl-D-alanine carboxypeptidase